jgi:hypothetical protein
MNDDIRYEPNAETHGTAPIQFFEADGSAPPAGTKATRRPADRPRELPPTGPSDSCPTTLRVRAARWCPGHQRITSTGR